MNPRKIALLIWIFILFLVAIGVASCSTAHKIKSTDQHHLDSATTKSSVQILVVKKDSTVYKEKDSSFKETITLNFDTVPAAAVPGTMEMEMANEYEAAAAKPLRGPYVYNIGGKTIRSAAPIKSAVIESSGHKTEIDLSTVKTTDSTAANNNETTHVVKDDKKTVTEKTSWNTPFIFTLLLIIVLVAVAWYALRRYKII